MHLNFSSLSTIFSYLVDVGLKKISKVLKSDVSADTLEQIIEVLLHWSRNNSLSTNSSELKTTNFDILHWLREIVDFNRFSLTVKLLGSGVVQGVIAWLDAYDGEDVVSAQIVRERFLQK